MAMGYPRIAREVVSLAAQLESNQKFYGCCIDGHLQWHCENLCLRNNADGEGMVAWLSEQAEILGILTAGHSSWQALAIISAMHDIWLTGQHVGVGRTADSLQGTPPGRCQPLMRCTSRAWSATTARMSDSAPNWKDAQQ